MKKRQVFNPYLPSYEYIPDGEPHVFGERLYIYGSHDRFDGDLFCMNDYVCYSADVHDLTQWRYEGIIFRKDQDPRNPDGKHCLWAPDVARGHDGRYYLYYCFDHLPEIGVAVCDTSAGKYQYLGLVRHEDGSILGDRTGDLRQFDPGVFVDEDGEIYLYSGSAPLDETWEAEGKGSQVMTLQNDMITLKTEPKLLIPDIHSSQGTGFEGHEFFEASSIRKVGEKYYFVYSSVQSHELCYCVSDKPDEGYRYGGTLVSIGDIFLNGRKREESLNHLGNTHGGMELVNGQWYIFYHRQTNRTMYSRQGCAEKIYIQEDGSIPQVEITSCGLNDGPLEGHGSYEARIACILQGKRGASFSSRERMTPEYPFFTQDGEDREEDPDQYIANMRDGAVAGYKYFVFQGINEIAVKIRPCKKESIPSEEIKGSFRVSSSLRGEGLGEIPVCLQLGEDNGEWKEFAGNVQIPDGIRELYLEFSGTGAVDLFSFEFRG